MELARAMEAADANATSVSPSFKKAGPAICKLVSQPTRGRDTRMPCYRCGLIFLDEVSRQSLKQNDFAQVRMRERPHVTAHPTTPPILIVQRSATFEGLKSEHVCSCK